MPLTTSRTSSKETTMPAPCAPRDPMANDPRSEKGMALILAILALLLLTFLGLTLTTTTSTELQISNNFKWSQQAIYNAEAGLEFARRIVTTAGPGPLLPPIRLGASWDPENSPANAPPVAPFPGVATRDFENGACDKRGNGQGYGVVLNDPLDGAANPFQNVTTLFGAPLRGAVTIWVRRATRPNFFPGYQVVDDENNNTFIITAEGIAPGLASPNRASRVIESVVDVTATGTGCDDLDTSPQASQTGFFAECPAP
jgi:hypothetical protein